MLTCQRAVAAAWAVWGPDPAIASIEFHYGNYCQPARTCPFAGYDRGHVIFHTKGLLRPDILVAVQLSGAGKVITSAPGAVPPLPSDR